MTTADTAVTANIIVSAVIMDDAGMANDSYAWRSDQHE